jgi:tRNA(Ile)-lysidine synthase
VLINMLRGAGLDGMSGMRDGWDRQTPDRMARIRRPLLGLRRRDTALVCRDSGWEPVTDPTNSDPRFVRNRVRSEVLPLLCDVAGRDIVPVLSRQADLLLAERDHLDAAAADLDPTDARALRSAPAVLVRRALRGWLRTPSAGADHEGHPPTAADIERVLSVVRNDVTACEISGGRRVDRSGGRLRVTAPAVASSRSQA